MVNASPRSLWTSALRLAILFALSFTVTWLAGAYYGEAEDPDEPAHLVTGLMVRDYLTTGWPANPLEFARDYYVHYPKVAIGHWPPVFYAEQAGWTLLFPATRPSLILMIALQSALIGLSVWTIVRNRYGITAAWLACLVLATLPGLMLLQSQVMTEIPLALLILQATLAWSRYLDTSQARHAAAFGLWSALAILTKGTGVVLAGIPLVSVWLAGRQNLLRRPSFWLPGLIVVAICAPWYLLAPGALHQRVASMGGLRLVSKRLIFPPELWAGQLGWIVATLTLLGFAALIYRRISGTTLEGIWASVTALVAASIAFPIFVGAWSARHQVEAAPAFLLTAVAGVHWLTSWKPFRSLPKPLWLVTGVLASLFIAGWNLSQLPRQHSLGYGELARAIGSDAVGAARTILISGDAVAEGAMISTLAQREPHPARYVVRSTKFFGDIGWMGNVESLKVHSSDDVHALLGSLPVDLVVIDRRNPAPYPYQPWLEQALAEHSEQWHAVSLPVLDQRFMIFSRVGGIAPSSAQVKTKLLTLMRDSIP